MSCEGGISSLRLRQGRGVGSMQNELDSSSLTRPEECAFALWRQTRYEARAGHVAILVVAAAAALGFALAAVDAVPVPILCAYISSAASIASRTGFKAASTLRPTSSPPSFLASSIARSTRSRLFSR